MLVYLLSAIETDEDRALFVDLFEKYLSLISIGAPQMIMDLKLIMENASLW